MSIDMSLQLELSWLRAHKMTVDMSLQLELSWLRARHDCRSRSCIAT